MCVFHISSEWKFQNSPPLNENAENNIFSSKITYLQMHAAVTKLNGFLPAHMKLITSDLEPRTIKWIENFSKKHHASVSFFFFFFNAFTPQLPPPLFMYFKVICCCRRNRMQTLPFCPPLRKKVPSSWILRIFIERMCKFIMWKIVSAQRDFRNPAVLKCPYASFKMKCGGGSLKCICYR